MNSIAWTTKAVLSIQPKRRKDASWLTRIRRTYEQHGYVTADMLCEAYKTNRKNARKRLLIYAPKLQLRVIRRERMNNQGWPTYVYGR